MALGVKDLPNTMQGAQVSAALAWCIREMRINKLHGMEGGKLNFNLKLDRRPFWGKCLPITVLLEIYTIACAI